MAGSCANPHIGVMTAMPTRTVRRVALVQLLVAGCAVIFGACVLVEHGQAQPGYVPPPTPLPPPVFNPSNPGTVPQPSYTPSTASTPSTPSTPGITPTIRNTVPSNDVTPPANEEPASTTAQAEREATTSSVHHHRARRAGYTWPYYCGSSPCVRIYPRTFYAYAAPVVMGAPVLTAPTLWWPGYYDYPAGQWSRGRPRYLGYRRASGYHGD
jgi:hypothetical protein